MSSARLEVRHASKTFAGVRVLSDVGLSVQPGEIHALVGQNGSGKSTLIKILSGVYHPDQGTEIEADGRRLGPPLTAQKLRAAHVSFVHQDLGLVPGVSVTDNIRIGRYAARRFSRFIDRASDRRAATAALERIGFSIHPDTIIDGLTASDRAAVAVARAIHGLPEGRGMVVFDESSRALPHEALPRFHTLIRGLARAGTAVLFVSHQLGEVLSLSDRVTVLRDGVPVASGLAISEVSERSLTRIVLGGELAEESLLSEIPTRRGAPVMHADEVQDGAALQRVCLTLRSHEVVGITGTLDSGVHTLAGVLAGADRAVSGEVTVRGEKLLLGKPQPRRYASSGVVYVPQDRARQGVAMEATVGENLTLPRVGQAGLLRYLRTGWQRTEFDRVVAELDVRPPRADLPIGKLSGGNQQKVLFGKWLMQEPAVLVLHEPLQAVDVGARRDLMRAMRAAASRGSAVLICSEEANELAAVCDRVLVLSDGRVGTELTQPFTSDDVLSAIYGDHNEETTP